MKHKLLWVLLLGGGLIGPALADLKQDNGMVIVGQGKALSRPASKNAQQTPALINNKHVLQHDNTLRCWQNGVLIVTEHDFQKLATMQPILVNKSNQKLYTFDYGETFCLYSGG